MTGRRRAIAVVACCALLALPCRAAAGQAVSRAAASLLEEAIAWYTGTAGYIDDARARRLLDEASQEGDPLARMWVARCYSRGRMTFPRDEPKARELAAAALDDLRRLADGGHPEALFLMGTVYDEGLGVTVDPTAAVAWLHRAAELGHGLAEHNLGNAYADGRGVPQSDGLAISWWRKAAAKGDAVPLFRLGEMYEHGRGVPADRRQAIDYYRLAAQRKYPRAAQALVRLGERLP